VGEGVKTCKSFEACFLPKNLAESGVCVRGSEEEREWERE